jgi:hydroxyethylthiazole kinase-like uncharacterized protein yjeF
MVRLFSVAQMRAADGLAVAAGIPGVLLMENAGRAVAEVAAGLAAQAAPGRAAGSQSRHRGALSAASITILVGKGNNGGDGLVAARHLAEQGFTVEVVLAEPGETFTGDALVNLQALVDKTSVRPAVLSGESLDLRALLARSSVVIDALLGTGAKGPPREPVATVIRLVNDVRAGASGKAVPSTGPSVLAVDLPSGLDADTGQASEPCVRADATVTLVGVKTGLVLPEAAPYVGRLYLAPIGLPEDCLERALARSGGGAAAGPSPPTHWLLPAAAAAFLPARPTTGHKGTFGHVWAVGGSPGYTGAAVLGGLGALRSGAGLATVACPEGCRPVIASALPELLSRGLPEGPDGRLVGASAGDLTLMLDGGGKDGKGLALVVGPGLGSSPEVAAFVSAILRGPGRRLPVVLDADALNAIALAGPGAVNGLLSSVLEDDARPRGAASRSAAPGSSRVVVTPHPGEMSRLVGRSVAEIQADRLGTARRAARTWGVVVVLKGSGTVVAAPDGAAWLNATGNPGLATAGSGDVLAGAIGTFLAQGLPPLEAALVAVSAHGLAGDLAARDIGRRGLLASDIAHRLPRALDGLAEATGYGPTLVAV